MSKETMMHDLQSIKDNLDRVYDDVCTLRDDGFSMENTMKFENLRF